MFDLEHDFRYYFEKFCIQFFMFAIAYTLATVYGLWLLMHVKGVVTQTTVDFIILMLAFQFWFMIRYTVRRIKMWIEERKTKKEQSKNEDEPETVDKWWEI